ncbi:MAG: hypothetical protein KBD78_10810, partial [Oligoflexales bacterium]|nr:hypothetical protein [Oligoflexales bacterium]
MKSSEAFSSNKELVEWVDSVANLTKPKQIVWCTGSEEENNSLIALMLADGSLKKLNQDTNPNSYLHTSAFNDVARTEHLTFVCTKNQQDAGPNNNWKEPNEGHAEIDRLFAGCMQGRTMYVIPYCMGPIDSPYARCGVEITDSAYVVANMRIMTRIGTPVLRRIEKEKTFVKGLHSTGDLSVENRQIMHFPENLMI